MTAAVTALKKGFDAADALALGLTAETIRQHIRIVSRHEQPKPQQPTYPGFGVLVEQAQEPIQTAIANYFSIVHARKETACETPPIQHAIVTGVASGKTEEILIRAIKSVKDGFTGVIFVPQHSLSVDLANRINSMAEEVICRVWFGIERSDPNAPGETMCRIVESAKRWQAADGDLSVLCKVCDFRAEPGKKAYDCCGYHQQKCDRDTKLWILPSNMAIASKPSNIPKPDFVIYDESPTQHWIAGLDLDYAITRDELQEERTFKPRKGDTRIELSAVSRDILLGASIALETSPAGPLSREIWKRLDVGRIRDVAKLEFTLATQLQKPIHSDIGTDEFKAMCEQAAKNLTVIYKRHRFWTLLADFLESGAELSPNLTITNAKNITMAWREDIHDDWSAAPTMVMDATMNVEITRQWFPRLDVVATVRLEAPHRTLTQVVDVPFIERQWNPNPKRSEQEGTPAAAAILKTQVNNANRMANFIEVKANEFLGQGANGIDILVIGQKRLIEYLRATYGERFGERVAFEHQNNVRGVDAYKGVRCLILVGRLEPPPSVLERRAGVIFGQLPEPIKPDETGRIRYPNETRHIRMKDGSAYPVKNHVHPDKNVQAVLEQICHAELLQCEGRGRGNRRDDDSPLEVIICTNVCLDLTVDKVIGHKELMAQGAGFRLMQARGIVPESWPEIAKILGHPDRFAARMWFSRHPEESAMLESFLAGAKGEHSPIGAIIGKCSPFDGWNRYPVRRAGCRKKAWVWIRGDNPAGVVKTFLGDDYTLLADAVPVAPPLRLEPEPLPMAEPELPIQADAPPIPEPLPLLVPANDVTIPANDWDFPLPVEIERNLKPYTFWLDDVAT